MQQPAAQFLRGPIKELGLIPHDQPGGPLVANLAAFWQQISPIVPVLPTVPTHKLCAVYNLAFEMAWKPNSPPAQSKLKGLSEAWPPRPLIDSMS